MWNEREAYFFIVSHAFICIRKQKQTKLDSFSFGTALSFYLFILPCCFFFVVFFSKQAVQQQQQRTALCGAEYLRRVSAESLSSHAGRPGCFALKRDLTFCGKVAHAALIRAAKRIREIHSASGAFFSPPTCASSAAKGAKIHRRLALQTSRHPEEAPPI